GWARAGVGAGRGGGWGRRGGGGADGQMGLGAGVPQERRTPVAVICPAAENLADGLVHEPAQVRRYGTVVRDEGRRLAEMVEQVLEFAGAYSGRRAYGRERVRGAAIGNGAAQACGAANPKGSPTGALDIPGGLPPVQGDPGALRRAVQTLVLNALKYGGDARWLRVTAAASLDEARPAVRIEVEDRGRGIPANELGHVFEPFFRG